MPLPYLLVRLKSLYETRGPAGLAAFLLSRIARIGRDRVFEMDLAAPLAEPRIPPALHAIVIDSFNLRSESVSAALRAATKGESAIYLQGLEKEDLLLCVVDRNQTLLHHSFVQFESRYKRLLEEERSTPLFTNCWTAPEARGQRLYPNVLLLGCRELAERGFRRAVITCDPDNTPSVRGITQAGFQQTRQITSVIVLSRFAAQKVMHATLGTRYRLCLL